MRKNIKKLVTATGVVLCSVPFVTLAALGDGKLTENTNSSLVVFLNSIQSWLLSIVGGLAILFIVYGGFLYVTSAGNQQRVETAKKTLTYAIVGLVIVVLAGLIFSLLTGQFLTSIFGGKSL